MQAVDSLQQLMLGRKIINSAELPGLRISGTLKRVCVDYGLEKLLPSDAGAPACCSGSKLHNPIYVLVIGNRERISNLL